MKKLIELLKQFDIKSGRQYPEYKIEKGIVYNVYHNPFEGDEYIDWTLNIISKQFGFIKWLVDNDKIDFSRGGDLAIELVNLFERKLDNADGVIALLSISDTPIEDLISYLK